MGETVLGERNSSAAISRLVLPAATSLATSNSRAVSGVHSGFVGVTEEQLLEAHRRDQAIEGDEGVHFDTAWLDPESGKVFCLSTGPSKESVLRIHERAGHPTTEIYEVPIEVH